MGIYYDPEQPAIVPDGFLSLGVLRFIDVGEAFSEGVELRLSYVLWEENIIPTLVLEVVSHKRRGEYTSKKKFYAELEILYYVVYNPHRRKKPPLEVYRLVNGDYVLQPGNPVGLPEVGLGIGRERGTNQGITREWLYWYDEQGVKLLTPEERITAAEQRAQMLAEQLRELGYDPNSLA